MIALGIRRQQLEARIAEIERLLPGYQTTRQHKARSLLIEELKQLKTERMKRDTSFRTRRRSA